MMNDEQTTDKSAEAIEIVPYEFFNVRFWVLLLNESMDAVRRVARER